MVRLQCPQCTTTFTPQEGVKPVCPNCGYTAGVASMPTPSPPRASPPNPGRPGSQLPPPYTMSPTGPTPGILEVKKTNGFAIAALVCGILGFLSYGVMSILAIIFGIVARNQIRERQEAGDGMALAGLILGIISLVIGVVLLLLLAYFGNSILQGL